MSPRNRTSHALCESPSPASRKKRPPSFNGPASLLRGFDWVCVVARRSSQRESVPEFTGMMRCMHIVRSRTQRRRCRPGRSPSQLYSEPWRRGSRAVLLEKVSRNQFQYSTIASRYLADDAGNGTINPRCFSPDHEVILIIHLDTHRDLVFLSVSMQTWKQSVNASWNRLSSHFCSSHSVSGPRFLFRRAP